MVSRIQVRVRRFWGAQQSRLPRAEAGPGPGPTKAADRWKLAAETAGLAKARCLLQYQTLRRWGSRVSGGGGDGGGDDDGVRVRAAEKAVPVARFWRASARPRRAAAGKRILEWRKWTCRRRTLGDAEAADRARGHAGAGVCESASPRRQRGKAVRAGVLRTSDGASGCGSGGDGDADGGPGPT